MQDAFARFLERGQAAARSATPAEAVAAELSNLIASGWKAPDPRYRTLQPGLPYGSYLLHLSPEGDFCVVQDVFAPGQLTGIHHHRTWGAVGTLEGCERNSRYAVAPDMKDAPRFLDSHLLSAGNVTTVGAGELDFHEVECASEIPSISLHVYGADIGRLERIMWDSDREAYRSFTSGYSNQAVGLPLPCASLA